MARKTSFYYAFLVLPPERRRGILAVFDFCRAVDDSVDLAPDAAHAEVAVAGWRTEIGRIFEGKEPGTPEGRAVQSAVRSFGIERQHFDALVDGVAMDARPQRFDTFADLEQYCHRVASAVGLMSIPVFGYRDAAVRDYARDLGVALQLTNILRDVEVDFRRGRVYLPTEDLDRFGCSAEDIASAVDRKAGPLQERLRQVLEHHAARARQFFARAAHALPRDEARTLLPAEIMRAIYWNLLQRIEARGCDVFGQVIRVPRPVQAGLAVSTWWAIRRDTQSS